MEFEKEERISENYFGNFKTLGPKLPFDMGAYS